MKILFICTSNADRSPALEKYFGAVYPQHEYRSAGINKYFCTQKGTHYLAQDDIDWADLIVFAEQIHKDITYKNFMLTRPATQQELDMTKNSGMVLEYIKCRDEGIETKPILILNCGNYQKGALSDDYLTYAEQKLKNILK